MLLHLALTGIVLIVEVIDWRILYRRKVLNSIVVASGERLCRPGSVPLLINLPVQLFPQLLLPLDSLINVLLWLVASDT